MQNVFSKELKSGTRGVIGALAGIGLKLSGSDGKIRGKFELEKSNLSVAELLGLNLSRRSRMRILNRFCWMSA